MFNPKHACLRGEPQRKADTTQAVGDDIINLVATFASCRDLCTLGGVCRRFAPLPARESLWELRALDILPSRPRLLSAMSELRITSYRQLVEAFTKIGIPGGVLGFWQAEKPSRSWAAQLEFSSRLSPPGRQGPTVEEEEARGELLRISLAAGRFQCDSIAPNGTSRCIFTIRILPNANQTVSIHFFSMEGVNSPATPFTHWIPGQGSGWVPVPTGTARTPIRPSGEKAFFLNRGGGRTCRFIKLKAPTPPPVPPTAPSTPAAALQRNSAMPLAAVAQSLCGLWSAPYGSHGLEIIQLSLDPCSAASGSPPPSSGGVAAAGQAEEAEVGRGAGARARAGLSKAEGRSTAAFSSSGKTSGSESVCTSAPATESEVGFGGSCGSVSSGSASGSASGNVSGSDAEEEDGDGGGGKMFRSRRVGRARTAPTNEDDGFGSETDEEEEESDCHEETGGGGRRAQSRFAAGGGGGAAAVSGGGGGDALLQPQLIGVKVTGDPNVPAGRTSFAIDLEGHCDVDAELEADRRPVVLFLPTGALMANLANRRGQISFWRKGRGQINRVPGRWSPEWVDVDFVAYKAGFSSAFSVVFRQPTQAVRVMLDFERALGSKEEWPQWPASAVPVQCRS